MTAIGQIVYNLQDYNNSGGYISSLNDNISQTISSSDPSYDSKKINIFSQDLVSKVGTSSFTKLGVQAPPGTKMLINSTKTVMVGRTGVYELDSEISVTNLNFIRPYKYVLDEIATEQNLTEGTKGFQTAEDNREQSLAALELEYQDKEKDEIYWQKYTEIQDEYIKLYNESLSKYLKGVNGIYVLPNPSQPESDENYEEIYNIIIDFLY